MGIDRSITGREYNTGSVNSIPPFLASIKVKKNGKNSKSADKLINPMMVLDLKERYTQASFHVTMYLS